MAESTPAAAGNTPEADAAAERKRAQTRERVARHRAAAKDPTSTKVGQRPGQMPTPPKGNPLAFSTVEGLGDRLSTEETKRNLVHAHLALARIVRSRVNLDDLDDEFESAASSYADIANHLIPWLRILPRLIAPLVLIGALLAIWGAMILQTPWVQEWWERRRAERLAREEAARIDAAAAATSSAAVPPAPATTAQAWANPTIVMPTPAHEADDQVEHPPVPTLQRGGLRKMG